MSPRPIFYVILDGLGDDPLPALDGRTPLEAARTPELDSLARRGSSGFVTTVGEGIAPESDIAVLAVLGYDPYEHHTGRGPLEAVGAGLKVARGDLAYRVNFATVEASNGSFDIVDRRVGRDLSSEEAHELAAELQDRVQVSDASFEFRATIGHRGVLVLRSEKGPFSAEVENSDPAYGRAGALGVAKETFDNKVVEVAPLKGHESDATQRAARITNEWLRAAFDVLDRSEINARRRAAGKLPGNFVLTRDGGDHLPDLVPFREKFGLQFGCFVEMPVELGIARLTEMGIVEAPPADGSAADQYVAWASLARDAIEGFDGLYIHIKGPDVPAHDGDHEAKIASIEAIDEAFFGTLLPTIDLGNTICAVTADHSTSCARKAHTDGPVPLVVAGGRVTDDAVQEFGETASRRGALGHLMGTEIMPNLVFQARA
ncbi:MAG TPA: alkaline phosphatase family protein [Actinomycetota bacterium]|nr:alkaline phosphatase family protein [Actinomycetota bacterium]